MPKYDLNSLGWQKFEQLCQSLSMKIISPAVKIYSGGTDGGRDASFSGKAPFPSISEQWDGNWIVQVKFHDMEQSSLRLRNVVVNDLRNELNKIVRNFGNSIQNYILMTNVPLTGTRASGLHDIIEAVAKEYKERIKNIIVLGGNEISRNLDNNPELTVAYHELLIPGHIIARMLKHIDDKDEELVKFVQMYCLACYESEKYTQLREAGDIDEKKEVLLDQIFIDLSVKLPEIKIKTFDETKLLHARFSVGEKIRVGNVVRVLTKDGSTIAYRLGMPKTARSLDISADIESPYPQWMRNATRDSSRDSALSYLLDDDIPNIVLVGGPGQGKSTLGQFVAEIYRARLIGKLDEINYDTKITDQSIHRIPIRIILRNFAQWMSKDNTNLIQYIRFLFLRDTGINLKDVDVIKIFQNNPTLLIFDGLDEVADKELRNMLMESIKTFVKQVREVLKANTRIIATTRPYGYTQEFDEKNYLHLTLNTLSIDQIKEYLEKWIKLREYDIEEKQRIKTIFNSCLTDKIIRILTKTPLQITILLLIIRLHGNPPKQREELFAEYVKILYQREQKKSLNLLKTERDIIFGLHNYIAFILHKRAENVKTEALMELSEFKQRTEEYLKMTDPISSESALKNTVNKIISEVRDRLVLIESPRDGYVGFGLTTFREFFAANYLFNHADDSKTRQEIFQTISTIPHWRNVALFFAGRIAREISGESANILESCRKIDTEFPDNYIKRGAELMIDILDDNVFRQNKHKVGPICYIMEQLTNPLHGVQYPIIRKIITVLSNMPQDHKDSVIRPFFMKEFEHANKQFTMRLLSNYIEILGVDQSLIEYFEDRNRLENNILDTILDSGLRNNLSAPWFTKLFQKSSISYRYGRFMTIKHLQIFGSLVSSEIRLYMMMGIIDNLLFHEFETIEQKFELIENPTCDELTYINIITILISEIKKQEQKKYSIHVNIPSIYNPNFKKIINENLVILQKVNSEMLKFFDTTTDYRYTETKRLCHLIEYLLDIHNYEKFILLTNQYRVYNFGANKIIKHVLGNIFAPDISKEQHAKFLDTVDKIKDYASFISKNDTYDQILNNNSFTQADLFYLDEFFNENFNAKFEKYLQPQICSKIKSLINEPNEILHFCFLTIDHELVESDLKYRLKFVHENRDTVGVLDRNLMDIISIAEEHTTKITTSQISMLKDILSTMIEINPKVNIFDFEIFESYAFLLTLKSLSDEELIRYAKMLERERGVPNEVPESTLQFLEECLANKNKKVFDAAVIILYYNSNDWIGKNTKAYSRLLKTVATKNKSDKIFEILRHYNIKWSTLSPKVISIIENNLKQRRRHHNSLRLLTYGGYQTKNDLNMLEKILTKIIQKNFPNYIKAPIITRLYELYSRYIDAKFDEKKFNIIIKNTNQ